MNDNIEFYYEQWCKTYVITPRAIKDVVDDGVFTKLIGFKNELLYVRKNPIDVKNMQKGFKIGEIS